MLGENETRARFCSTVKRANRDPETMADCTESKINIRGCEVLMRRGGNGETALFLHGASGVAGWIPGVPGPVRYLRPDGARPSDLWPV